MTRDEAAAVLAAERLNRLHGALTTAVSDLVNGPAWQRLLDVAARFPAYSPNNLLLIAAQRPDATQVAGFVTWRRLGRAVRRGERGIAILAPVLRRPAPATQVSADQTPNEEQAPNSPGSRRLAGFRVAYVFDVAQTDGPPLPTAPAPELLPGAAPAGLRAALETQLHAAGYRLDTGDLGSANGLTDFTTRTVTLAAGLSPAQACKTLAHELAHTRLHHPDHIPPGTSRATAEVEAESVAYLVASSAGLDCTGYTVPYIAGWSAGEIDRLHATATRVIDAAHTIIAAIPDPTAQQQASRAIHAAERGRQHDLVPAVTRCD